MNQKDKECDTILKGVLWVLALAFLFAGLIFFFGIVWEG